MPCREPSTAGVTTHERPRRQSRHGAAPTAATRARATGIRRQAPVRSSLGPLRRSWSGSDCARGPTAGTRVAQALVGRCRGCAVSRLTPRAWCCLRRAGEDGSLQGMLDCARVAYSRQCAAAAALGWTSSRRGEFSRAAGVPTLPRVTLGPGLAAPAFAGPYIVKPRYGGSSIGIDVVKDWPTVQAALSANVHLRQGAVAEAYRDDLYDLQVFRRCWPTRKPPKGHRMQGLSPSKKAVLRAAYPRP